MINVGILGANGRMGCELLNAIPRHSHTQLCAAIVRENSPLMGLPVHHLARDCGAHLHFSSLSALRPATCDVLIDFTLPEALDAHLLWCEAQGVPLVVGTTGLGAEQLARMQVAAERIPIVFAANYSKGVNLLLELAAQAAQVMGEDADIEILEAHHRFKLDAPSGTALALGQAVANRLQRDLTRCAVYGREGKSEERDRNTIGFATVRAGDIVGEHTVLFATMGERIELTHKASSRSTFAMGALDAAAWLKGQAPGLYSMRQVLGFEPV